MGFDTEKNKLRKLWNEVESNQNIVITQNDNNNIIIENINELNRPNAVFSILIDFSTDWTIPTVRTTGEPDTVQENFIDFKLTFKNIDELFIPYIHGEIVYRVGTSGLIPLDDDVPFDEEIGESNDLQTNEVYQIIENLDGTKDMEYIRFMRMDFRSGEEHDVEYRFFAHIINPHYYQST